jgi:hypothetical protein
MQNDRFPSLTEAVNKEDIGVVFPRPGCPFLCRLHIVLQAMHVVLCGKAAHGRLGVYLWVISAKM